MCTGIVEFIGIEKGDAPSYCGAYWNRDNRCAQVLWNLLG